MGLGKTLTIISHILKQKTARAEHNKDEWLNKDKKVDKCEYVYLKMLVVNLIIC